MITTTPIATSAVVDSPPAALVVPVDTDDDATVLVDAVAEVCDVALPLDAVDDDPAAVLEALVEDVDAGARLANAVRFQKPSPNR